MPCPHLTPEPKRPMYNLPCSHLFPPRSLYHFSGERFPSLPPLFPCHWLMMHPPLNALS